MSELPKYYPRAQMSGTLRWTCVQCARINETKRQPTSGPRLQCAQCSKYVLYGHVFHPAGRLIIARDQTIPQWIGEDEFYQLDPIPPAIWMNQPVKQRGRVNMLLISEGIYALEPVCAAG